MKILTIILVFIVSLCGFSQEETTYYKTKKMAIGPTIQIDSMSINPKWFSLYKKDKTPIDTTYYSVDFSEAILTFKKPIEGDSILINYLQYPEFLTKTYTQLDEKIIVSENRFNETLYKMSRSNHASNFIPFDGLTTSGSISRGVRIGNNQNSVLNSELDLQITGKLNDKVSLRASIQDANIPLQESGYSQRLDEFDQVFIELFSDRWHIRAGDIDLQNTNSYFSNFSKRVQGLNFNVRLGDQDKQTNIFASGAIVRGQFTTSQFVAQEGNQGPYKLQGKNGELFVLIVSGSETVYVNGVPVKRGEDQDYIIDYNAGEIIFNATFPITSEMRITVDYQFSDRNYSRFVAYGGSQLETSKLKLGVSVYSESDAKNQPLQQNLTAAQIEILSRAGDARNEMVAPSAVRENLNENRILYKKERQDGQDIFVFSNDTEASLYRVTFSLVGNSQGDYILQNNETINHIYEYVGIGQGNYAPVVQLIAPTKLQIAVLNAEYNPTEKTSIHIEASASKNDLNLFSNIDDQDNSGLAGKITINQTLIKNDSLWDVTAFFDSDYIQSNYRNLEGLYNPEFNRDWNLDTNNLSGIGFNLGHQTLVNSGLKFNHSTKGFAYYHFEHLSFTENFNANRHRLDTQLFLNKLHLSSNSSILSAQSGLHKSRFLKSYNRLTYSFKNRWIGTRLALEHNEQSTISDDLLTPLSQQFKSYEVFVGIGDSTRVYTEIGYKNRVNDSIRNNQLETVNTSNTFYLDSKLIQNKKTLLSLYVNYRTLNHNDEKSDKEHSLNSRLQFNKKLFHNTIIWHTIFETNSGTLPQQDFTYVEVEPGQGNYTWLDYNDNGIQELEEFETAPFQDQGTYIRVLLPNRVFIKTHQNRLSQTLTINPAQWSVYKSKKKTWWTYFYNQTSYLIDRKNKRNRSGFQLNPFDKSEDSQLGLQLNFRNVLFFNRGKQHFTTSYTYLENVSRNVLSIGFVENNLKSHQINFNHKVTENWLINMVSTLENHESISENFATKNFKLNEIRQQPKLSYLFNENSSFDLFYQYTQKNNTIGFLESLKQQQYGVSFSLASSQKQAVNGAFNYFSNTYEGNANTPVAYQILEGLQPGKNFTWNLMIQKKLTPYLDLNLSYLGRKTKQSRTIHSGNIQLKAYF